MNQVPITIAGKDCFMRPDMRALMAIEDGLGTKILRLIQAFNTFDAGAADIIEVVYQGLISGSGKIDKETIKADLDIQGLAVYLKSASDFLGMALTGPKKPETPEVGLEPPPQGV